jgi:hypothetical protein
MLGQDTIEYTSANAKVLLRITKAMDVRADNVIVEDSRERGALKYGITPMWDMVTATSTIEIENRKAEAIQMRVRQMVFGEIVKADNDGAILKLGQHIRSVNASSRVEWNPKVQPGQKLRLTMTFKTYVPTSG